MNSLISMAVKFSGFGWVWDKIDGYKTYIQAAAEMLTGISGMALSAAAESTNFVASVHSIGDTWAFVQMLFKHPDPPAVAFTLAYATVIHGWGVMAKKHADDKRHAELMEAQTTITNTAVITTPIMPPPSAAPAQ